MLKKFLFSFIISFLFLIPYSFFLIPVHAEGEFITDVSAMYKVNKDGNTLVTNTFTIENVLSELYVTNYSLILENVNPVNPKAYEDGRELSLTSKKDGDKTTLTVNLDTAVVGKGKKQSFSVSYEDNTLASRTGEVWEISIPRLSEQNSFKTYSVTLSVPSSFGQEAYISPKPQNSYQQDGQLNYFFNKDDVAKAGITAGFGQFQVFSFTLNYHLENPLAKQASIDVAIPPDTAMQKIYYRSINPAPYRVHVDKDGNWLATFLLSQRQRINVEAKGFVQIFATQRPFPAPSQQVLADNLMPTIFWQTNDPAINALAKRLGSPRAIYDYVSQNLSYDYGRVAPNVTRLGAIGALASPKNAICTEFTDLFIALARAAGIPAREINGYAYTENPKVQPLSLVADVLHAWPEYWDKDKKTWIPVDPTWGSTSGVDFFSKLDLRHFTFVIHGEDSQQPYPPGSYKLGENPQKDVFVSFAQLPPIPENKVAIDYASENNIPFMPRSVIVRIKNTGQSAIYNLAPTVLFDKIQNQKMTVEVLPPYGTYEFQINLPFSFLGKELPDEIFVSAGTSRITIPTYKNQVIVYNLIGLFTLFSVAILVVLIRLKKLSPSKLIFRLWTRVTLRKK